MAEPITLDLARLRDMRQARGLTRRQLAAKVGRLESTIKHWEAIGWAPPEVWEALRPVIWSSHGSPPNVGS